MPRNFTNKKIYGVWVQGRQERCRTFTELPAAENYAMLQKKYNTNVLTKILPSYKKIQEWFTEQDAQFSMLNSRTVKMDGAVPLSLPKVDGPEQKFLDLVNTKDPEVCLIYSDCSYRKGELARLGVWSESLNFQLTEILAPEDNHQSGEIKGIFVALMKFVELGMTSGVNYKKVICISDNDWAVKTMTVYVIEWIRKWGENGRWLTSKKQPVKHVKIIRGIRDLQRTIENRRIDVEYVWIDRKYNDKADMLSRQEFIGCKPLREPTQLLATEVPVEPTQAKPEPEGSLKEDNCS